VFDTLHQMIEEEGRAVAVARQVARRPVVEAAAGFLADELHDPAFVYSGWCLAALPHRRPADAATSWEVNNGPVTLLVEPGRIIRTGKPAELVGVPFGIIARLILIYLCPPAGARAARPTAAGAPPASRPGG
jgi:hypothetical protein